MKKLLLFPSLAFLLSCAGCGFGNGDSGGTLPPPVGSFSNASLNGQYVYQLTGIDGTSTFREAGVFIADGNGHITGGTDDFTRGSGSTFGDPITGSYTVRNDGVAVATFNLGSGPIIEFTLALVSSSKAYIIETDTFATSAGVVERQDPLALSGPPSGTFAFRMHTSTAVQSSASVGTFAVAGGVVTSGNEDVNRGGLMSSLTLSGSFNVPDSLGRGTGTFTDSSLVTSSFIYYIVDANNVHFLSSDLGVIGLGQAEKQTGGPFTNSSLSGGYAFGSRGDTASTTDGVRTVGRFAADGSGNISNGAFDSVGDGATSTNVSFTGSYSMAATGRAAVTLTTPSGTVTQVFWMVNPSRAFFLVNDSTKVEDGSLDAQSGASFSNSSLNGQFAFVMDGFNPSFFIGRVGTLRWDGAGGLSLREFANASGQISEVFSTGTYSVSNNGRTTGSVSGISNNFVFYLVSGNDGYILQNDSGTEINGVMDKQP